MAGLDQSLDRSQVPPHTRQDTHTHLPLPPLQVSELTAGLEESESEAGLEAPEPQGTAAADAGGADAVVGEAAAEVRGARGEGVGGRRGERGSRRENIGLCLMGLY